MPAPRGNGEAILKTAGLLIFGLVLCRLAAAGPVELPDSARPGAVRPEHEERAEVPKPPPGEVMDVPAVIDRPFDPLECPCIVVREFRLLNAEDLPKYEVSLEDIQKILDQAIQQQTDEGYSIGQIQEVGKEVQNYYREKGLILATVVVPVQTVENGVVDLELYVGTLGRVLAEGNEIYSQEVLEQAFRHLIGEPISKADTEAALLRLTDYPGLTIFGVFQPGVLVGTADLVLKVQEEKRFDVAMRVDDHGTQETGRNRLRTVIVWNNPTGGADRLALTIQQSYNPKSNVFKGLDYERFLYDGSWKFRGFYNTNKFDVGGEFAAAQIHTDVENLGASIEKSFIRSRLENLSAYIGFTKKHSDTSAAFTETNEERLSVFSFGVNYDFVDTFTLSPEVEGGGINFATLELSQGVNDFAGSMGSHADAVLRPNPPIRTSGTSGKFAPGMFTKLFGTYTRLQTLQPNQNLLFRGELQWSDDLLVPLEQYSAGGPDNVRAFPVAQVLWDRAAFLSFEWLINAPFIADQIAFENRTWGELLQFSAFYDVAVGRVNEPIPGVDKKDYDNIKGAGVGLRFSVPGSIESRLFWAWEIGGDDVGNERSTQVWGDFTYTF